MDLRSKTILLPFTEDGTVPGKEAPPISKDFLLKQWNQ